MKMVKNITDNTVSAIRTKKFLIRTGIMLVLSFLALLGVSIAFDMVYQTLARHSLAYVVAGLTLGQVYLYKNDISKLKGFLSNAAKDPVGWRHESSEERVPSAAAGSAVSMSEGIGAAFVGDDDVEDDGFPEDFEDGDEI